MSKAGTTPTNGDKAGSVKRQPGDHVPFRIESQGAVSVNAATVERDYGDCLLINIDLHSKYAVLRGTGSGSAQGPLLYLAAEEHTLHLDETKPKDMETEIEFHEHKGWRVFCADGPGRYTLRLTLLAPEMPG